MLELTYSECKQIVESGNDLREFIERFNDQPLWLLSIGGIDSLEELQNISDSGCAANASWCDFETNNKDMQSFIGDDILSYLSLNEMDLIKLAAFYHQLSTTLIHTAVELWCSEFHI